MGAGEERMPARLPRTPFPRLHGHRPACGLAAPQAGMARLSSPGGAAQDWGGGAGVSCLFIYRADVCRGPLPGSFWCFTCLPSPSPRSVPGRWGLSLRWMAGAWNPSAEGSRGVRGVPN